MISSAALHELKPCFGRLLRNSARDIEYSLPQQSENLNNSVGPDIANNEDPVIYDISI